MNSDPPKGTPEAHRTRDAGAGYPRGTWMGSSLGTMVLGLVLVAALAMLLAAALHLHRSNRQLAFVQARNLAAVTHRHVAELSWLSPMNTSKLEQALARFVPVAGRISVLVWREDGTLLAAAGGPAGAKDERPPSRQGEVLDVTAQRLLSWQTDPLAGRHVLVVTDLTPLLTEAHNRTMTTLALLGSMLLVLCGGATLVIWPQFRALRSLTSDAERTRPRPNQQRPPFPGWLARDLAVLWDVLRQTDTMVERRRPIKGKSLEILQACIDLVPFAQGVLDTSGRLLFVNQGTLSLLNAKRSELIHARLVSFVAPEHQSCLKGWTQLATSGADGGTLVNEQYLVEFERRDGARIPIRLSMTVIRPGERPLLMFQAVDLREELARTDELERALDAARASSQAKIRFLATLSHEIRTPLNGLSGMMDLLERTQLGEEQRELMEMARRSTRQLRLLLNDLLDLSKIEAGKLVFETIPFDIEDQLGNAMRPFRGIAKSRGLSFACDWSTPVRMLLGDPHRICQVLNNLLDNALKFTEQGGISVHVTTTATDGGDHCELKVDVVDTGIGVPPERGEAIFEAFAQVDESTSRKYGGTGLGLALSRQLCQHMGGGVQFRPNESGGSCFSFSIVCPVAHGMSPFVDSDIDVEEVGRSLQARRALVVDDNVVNQMLLTRWLQREGMTVVCAQDGLEGVRAVTEQHFDIVLMDVSMPVMNGLDATKAIRALAVPHISGSQRFLRLPIIGISAHAMQGDQDNCLSCGMNDYVTKPILRDLLLSKMSSAIGACGLASRGGNAPGARLHAH